MRALDSAELNVFVKLSISHCLSTGAARNDVSGYELGARGSIQARRGTMGELESRLEGAARASFKGQARGGSSYKDESGITAFNKRLRKRRETSADIRKLSETAAEMKGDIVR